MKINSKLFTNSGGQTLCHQCSTQTLPGEACYCMHMWPQTCKGILKCGKLHVQIKLLNKCFLYRIFCLIKMYGNSHVTVFFNWDTPDGRLNSYYEA